MATAGEDFAAALAAKDSERLRGLLADQIDFQALTPGRHWQAGSPAEVADEIIFGFWFAPDADIKELRSVTTGEVAGREHVRYLLQVAKSGQDYLVEQQAYYDSDGGQISWMRVLCSGYRPVSAESPISP